MFDTIKNQESTNLITPGINSFIQIQI